jgi:hypothetical protein
METMAFERLSLDEALDRLRAGVASLSRRQAAAFFAICGEALFPLYLRFVEQSGWGDPDVLRAAEKSALEFAAGGSPRPESTSALLEAIAAVTPDGERFDAPESTFAQDVAICMDAAVRSSNQAEKINPGWVEYVLEPATVAASEEQTGYLDPGDSIQAEEWRATALKHSGLRRAFETSAELIRVLAMKPSVSSSDVAELRSLAAGLLVPTQ